MEITDNYSEIEEVVLFFEGILQIFSEPTHFKRLAEHLVHAYAGRETFFHPYSESQMFAFFRSQSERFLINSDGFVSLVKDEIIKSFVKVIRASGPQRFLKLISTVKVASTHFSQSSTSKKLNFFKKHPEIFSIRDSEYIVLAEENSTACESFYDEKETELLVFFQDYLASFGPVYFSWFFESLHDFNCVNEHLDELCVEVGLWKFLKSHPLNFTISDQGFVDLTEGQKSTIKVDTIISGKEEDTVGFFIAKLVFCGSIIYPLLLKLLQDSTHDIKHFFAKQSLNDIHNFFKKRSNIFVTKGRYVSLWNTISFDRWIKFDGFNLPFEEKQEAIFFFLDCLKAESPIHFLQLSLMLKNSSIDTNFKLAFLESSVSVKFWFFKNNSEVFHVGNNGYVSLYSLFTLSAIGKQAILHSAKKLKVSSPENFWTLISSLETSSKCFKNYFANFSPPNKFYFFKKYSDIFSVDADGYVTCETEPIVSPESEAVKVLVEKLKTAKRMHFQNLCNFGDTLSEEVRKFFELYSVSEKYRFFKERSEHFNINNDGYVSLPTSSTSCSKLEDLVSENISYCQPLTTANDAIYMSEVNGIEQNLTNSCHVAVHPLVENKESTMLVSVAQISNQNLNGIDIQDVKEVQKIMINGAKNNENLSLGIKEKNAASTNNLSFHSIKDDNTVNKDLSFQDVKENDAKSNNLLLHDVNSESNEDLSFHGVKENDAESNKDLSFHGVKENDADSNKDLSFYGAKENDAESNKDLSFHGAKDNDAESNEDLSFYGAKENDAESNEDLLFHDDISVTKGQSGNELLNMSEVEISEVHHQGPPCNIALSNTTEKLHSISSTKSSISSTYLDDMPSDTDESRQKEQLNKTLIDILKAYKQVHYEKLCYYNECSDAELSNYFLSYSNLEKYDFFKNQPDHYFVGIDGYVSLPSSTQNHTFVLSSDNLKLHETNTAQQSWPSMSLAKSSVNGGQKRDASISSNTNECTSKTFGASFSSSHATSNIDSDSLPSHTTPNHKKLTDSKQPSTKEDNVIEILKYYLNIQKRMHCLALCKVAKTYFMSYSPSQKFSFFKDRPQHFCIDNDNYVTFPSAASYSQTISTKILRSLIAGNTSTVSKKQRRKIRKNEVIKILVKTLQNQEEVHFEKLCKGDENIVTTYFQSLTTSAKFLFFKQNPKVFSIASNGYVSLPKVIENTDKFSVCDNLTSKASSSVKSSNSMKNEIKLISALMKKKPARTPPNQELGNVSDSDTPRSHSYWLRSHCISKCKDDLVSPVKISSSINSVPSSQSTSIVDEGSFGDRNIQVKDVINAFKMQLRSSKHMHYLELCTYVESYSEMVQAFFGSQCSLKKLHFFEKYPNDFHVSDNNIVCLPEFEKNFFNTVSVTKPSSPVPFEYLQNLETEVIDSLIGALKVFERVHFEKLCKCNDMVENFFVSYSTSEKYKFYRSRPQYFCVASDSYVSLFKDAEGSSKLEAVAAPESLKSNVNSDHTCENDEAGNAQSTTIVPVESSSQFHAANCNNNNFVVSSGSLWHKNMAANCTTSKRNGKFCSSIVSTGNEETKKSVCSIESECINNNASVLSSDTNAITNSKVSETNNEDSCIAIVTTRNNKMTDMSKSGHSSDVVCSSSEIVRESQSKIDSANVRQEIIEILINQLRIDKYVYYLELCNVCEQSNGIIRNFFHFLPNTIKLDFLKSYPQYFLVDSDNFVKISSASKTSSKGNSSSPSRQAEHTTDFCNSFGINPMEGSQYKPLSKSPPFGNENPIVQNAHMEELTQFFRSLLCNADVLHYEELFIELEDSDHFTNYLTSFEQIDRLKFFKDRPEIFYVQSQGFVSLVPGATSEYFQKIGSKTKNICNEPIPDIIEGKSNDEFIGTGLCLGHYHITAIKYFINILHRNQPLHFKELVKNVCVEYPDAKSFFLLFKASIDVLDFFKLHPMYFIIEDEEMISLKRSDVSSKNVLCTDAELQHISGSIVVKAIDFYTCLLKSKVKISLKESESQLNLAPGYVISFMNTNYPGSKIVKFFKDHPNHFQIDDNDWIILETSRKHSKSPDNTTKESMVFSEAICSRSENNGLSLELRGNHMIASKAQVNEEVSSQMHKNIEISSRIHNINVPGNQENKKAASEIEKSIKVGLSMQENFEVFTKAYKGNNNNIAAVKLSSQYSSSPVHKLRPTISINPDPSSERKINSIEIKCKDFLNERFSSSNIELPVHMNKGVMPHKIKPVEPSIRPRANYRSIFLESYPKRLPSNHNKNIGNEITQVCQLNRDFKQKLMGTSCDENQSDIVQKNEKAPIIVKPRISRSALDLSCFNNPDVLRSQHSKCYPTQDNKFESNLSLPVTKNQVHNTASNIHSLMPIIPNSKSVNVDASYPLSNASSIYNDVYTTANHSNVSMNKSVDQLSRKGDEINHLINQQRLQELLKELNPIARIFNSELEILCVNFFKDIIQKKTPKILHVQFLDVCASESPDAIRTYLSHYLKRGLLLFFYLHLDHFVVDPSGYVNIKVAPDRSKTDDELEVKTANFFISLIYFSFKGKVLCNVLERCLHLASEEVQLYVKKTYATNLKLFFSNHPDHFYVDVFNNVFVQDEENSKL